VTPRLPVTVVAGFAGAGKSTLIDHWLRGRPAGERWAVLANASAVEAPDEGAMAPASHRAAGPRVAGLRVAEPRGVGPGVRLPIGRYRVVGGCACCTAQASARSALVALLRAGPWERLVVELDGAAHPATLVDLLRRPPFDALLRIDDLVTVVDAARPAPFEAEPMHPLAQAQVEVATRIVLNRVGRLAEARRAVLVRRLADAPPFGRAVEMTDDGRAAWTRGVDQGRGVDPSCAADRARGPHEVAGAPANPATQPVEWHWPDDRIFDRPRLQALAVAWQARLPLSRAVGVFRTERDWYRWRLDGSGTSWEASAYRLESRLQLYLDAPCPVGTAAPLLAAIETELAGAVNPEPA
jgi:G3E family GTPase